MSKCSLVVSCWPGGHGALGLIPDITAISRQTGLLSLQFKANRSSSTVVIFSFENSAYPANNQSSNALVIRWVRELWRATRNTNPQLRCWCLLCSCSPSNLAPTRPLEWPKCALVACVSQLIPPATCRGLSAWTRRPLWLVKNNSVHRCRAAERHVTWSAGLLLDCGCGHCCWGIGTLFQTWKSFSVACVAFVLFCDLVLGCRPYGLELPACWGCRLLSHTDFCSMHFPLFWFDLLSWCLQVSDTNMKNL